MYRAIQRFIILILTCFLFVSCNYFGLGENTSLPSQLTFLVQEDHWFYQQNSNGQLEGFNYELIEKIRTQLHIKIEVKTFASESKLYEAFEAGQGDVMCPALSLDRVAWEKTHQPKSGTNNPTFFMELAHQSFPTLRFKVSDNDDFIWVLREKLTDVSETFSQWSKNTQSQLFLANLYEKYFAHLGLFNKFDLMMLKTRYTRDLPKFKDYFAEAGKLHNLDPLFLAAMAYQESHWNPQAKSFTGVRGLMMLTQSTATALGIQDRMNPRDSILGGTKYLEQMKQRLDSDIGHPDKDYYALAAYNVGLGHLRDAQDIIKSNGQDPKLWSNLRDTLPLLEDPAYYKGAKFGKARGQEPVRYVDSIRNYYSFILKLEKEDS